jgi:aminoglycoside phosphotransferase (APT) family kinase protein
LSGGVSNRAVTVQWPGGASWVLKQALPKLRVAAEWFSSPQRITVEAKALRLFNGLLPGSTPEFLFHDQANYILGMEAVPEGHANWKALLLSGRIDLPRFTQFGELLGSLHRDSSLLPPANLEEFCDTTHFETLRIEPFLEFSAINAPCAAEFLRELAGDLLRQRICLVHGDFSPKNALIHRDRFILLDFEVVHWGDPAFDVGFAMAHFLSKAHHMVHGRGRLVAGALLFWAAYQAQICSQPWAPTLEQRCVRNTLGCLLARAIGKSPLEYLTSDEIANQRDAILRLINQYPCHLPDLVREFVRTIEAYATH